MYVYTIKNTVLGLQICTTFQPFEYSFISFLCDNEMKMNVLHVIGDLFYIFPTSLLYWSFLFHISVLCNVDLLNKSMVYMKIKVKFSSRYHVSAHIATDTICAIQPWIQNVSWIIEKLNVERYGIRNKIMTTSNR